MTNSFDLTGKPGLEEFIRRQIASAVEAEREACARIAEKEPWCGGGEIVCGKKAAWLIRARSAIKAEGGE